MVCGTRYGDWSARRKSNIFLWRMSHNTLAMKRVLEHRGVKTDTLCSICNRLDEDGEHLFFKCKEVKVAWCELNLEGVR